MYNHFLGSFIPLCVGCGKGGDDKKANIDDDENDNVGDKMGDEENIRQGTSPQYQYYLDLVT